MISKKWLLPILGVLLVLTLGALFFAAPQEGELSTSDELAQLDEDGNNPNVVGDNVSFVVTDGERKKWLLIAKKAYYYEDQSGARLEDVHGEFYNKEGTPILKFKAPAGNYKNANNAVSLSGGVLAESMGKSEGSLQAPRMTWNVRSDKVLADGGNVVMKFPQGVSRAQRCRFTLDFSVISLEGGVVSEISQPD